MMGKTSQKTLNMFMGQPCCICFKENNCDVKGSETDAAGIYCFITVYSFLHIIIDLFSPPPGALNFIKMAANT